MFNLFSSYAHPLEKSIERFLKHISEKTDRQIIHTRITELLQTNTVVLSLWIEKRFKNYRYLRKPTRQRLYTNSQRIVEAFQAFQQTEYQPNLTAVQQVFTQHQLPFPQEYRSQLLHLQAITEFLKPGKRYQYLESATFGKLLKNPQQETLIGDCNQIVTLYVFLYAQAFPVSDLQVKVLPEHVCLHMKGIDIEATNGTFTLYREFETIAQISELVAINLLDVHDFREKTATISTHSVVKSSQLAYKLSSMRELVTRNLRVAYHNLAIYSAQKYQFKKAVFYAKKLNDSAVTQYIHQTAAQYYVKQHQYDKAKFHAKAASDQAMLTYVLTAQANRLFEKKSYTKARALYQQLSNQRMVQATYQQEYNQLAQQVQSVRTREQMKKKEGTYKKMLILAKKAGLTEQEQQLRKLLQQ